MIEDPLGPGAKPAAGEIDLAAAARRPTRILASRVIAPFDRTRSVESGREVSGLSQNR